jgi:hypothetical protein
MNKYSLLAWIVSAAAAVSTVAVASELVHPSAHRSGHGELSDKPACRKGTLRCVHTVIATMDQRGEKLAARCDHDAVFAIAYLRTTEVFLQTAESLGYADLPSVIREDALFADYYFRAYDAYHFGHGPVPPAWQIAFDAASTDALPAVGDAFLGFSAHIQRDLPFVLYALHLQGHPVSHEDHTLVNEFLAQVDVAGELARRFDSAYPLEGDADLIEQWRETAFQNFERLRDANEVERVLIAAEIEYSAAASAAFIYQSTAYPPGTDSSERDAHCRAAR